MTKLDPFYPVVDSAQWVKRLVGVGAKLIQLRIKDMELPLLRREIQEAREICLNGNCQLVINDHWQIALEEDCDFIHIGQEDLETADLAAIRRANMRFGLSTHSQDELETALSVAPDYVALGPIWPTQLKVMPWEPQTPQRLAEWRRQIGALPLVAIGGITLDRAPEVFRHGATCAAVVRDIVASENPENHTLKWLSLTRKFDIDQP
ncbi:thiamine phosphate synthase [Aureimonas fodinaquatilis]|uniref:Thiamine-phosphate synthase n=1 Tax=Aureimonas fodinaquatilis TaxID=2565783 RepID=A0A5B0E1M3_9HYPH|nr:thiamine phosphate synthase [Aureimonas fodinaquatilis]KAA0972556.1 thiamine phosphate synthase [Aureimonas fodinaquatilis]